MAKITVEQTEAFIHVTVAVEYDGERNLGQRAAAAARKVADGKITRISSGGSFIDGVQTLSYTYVKGPSKADLAAERSRQADAELAARVRAEVEREWAKIIAGNKVATGCILTTAEEAMLSAEENADLSAAEVGFELRSDKWYSYVLSGYESNLDCAEWMYECPELRGEIYIRNIAQDITNGVIETL